MVDLNDKIAVITGAANGLGKAMAFELYRQGCHLALLDIDLENLKKIKSDWETSGQKISIHLVDVSNENEIIRCKEEIIKFHSHIDLLVNNAGVSISRLFEETSVLDFKELFDTNFWGTVFCTKYFLSELKKRNQSHVVNIVSIFGQMGFPGKTAYASSKAALIGFSNSLKTELCHSSVKVSLVIPPPLATDLVLKSIHVDDEKRNKENQFLKKRGMQVDKAARKIISKIKKNRYRIVIGRSTFWADLALRVFPTAFHKMICKNKKNIDFI